MKKVSLFVYDDAVLVAVSAALDMLTNTNRYLQKIGRAPAFDIELVSEKTRDIRLHQPAQFTCNRTLDKATDTDMIIIPSFIGEPEIVRSRHSEAVAWIRNMYLRGTEVVSLCRGSYFLAEAGILEGKPCTSHWQAIDDMKSRYPGLMVQPDIIVTDRDGVYTSGGAFSSIHVILYLIEKFCGRDIAIPVSKYFSLDIGKISQAHFAVFQGQKGHGDEEILRAQHYIEKNYRESISVEEVARQSHMSKRNFIRRFTKATHNTPLEYIQRVRIEAAKKSIETGNSSINEIMYESGYSDIKSFRTVFRKITGLSPMQYRNKYHIAVPVA